LRIMSSPIQLFDNSWAGGDPKRDVKRCLIANVSRNCY